MKKIIGSLAVVLVLGAIVATGTGAFFSDTETSSANVLTAGAIDLKVDHLKQTYNDVDCKTCSVAIQSDTTNEVTAQIGGIDPGPFPHPAVLVTNINPAWTASVPGASWIWWTDPTPEAEKGVDTTYTFKKTFTWMGPISGATLSLAAAADNGYEVRLNGNLIGSDSGEQNYNAAGQDLYTGFSSAIIQGTNTLEIKVKNMLRPEGQTWDNPGGLLYKLEINGNCDNDYFKTECRLWGEKDLTQGDTFFKFNDVKPGDRGVNVLSLHVFNNDAKACIYSGDITDQDNTCTEPESASGDPTCNSTTPTDNGELDDVIHFFAWEDDNDGVYEGENVLVPVNSPISLLKHANPMNLLATTTAYVGIAWCAGTQGLSGNTITCDGSQVDNASQTDSITADLTAYAVQSRNNANFTCSMVNGNGSGPSSH